MTNSLEVLFLRRPKIDYISPPICEAQFSSSGGPVIVLNPLTPLGFPTGLILGGVGGFLLSWDSFPGALCYSLYKADTDDPFGSYTIVAECIPYAPVDLTVYGPGDYRITAITKDGETPLSLPIHFSTGGGGTPFGCWYTFEDVDPHKDSINNILWPYSAGAPVATSTIGKIGDGWNFAMGGNNSVLYATGDQAKLAETGTGFTIYFWIKFDVLSGGTNQLVSLFYDVKDGDGNLITTFLFQYSPGQFRFVGPGGSANQLITVHDMGLGNWVFVRCSYDSSNGQTLISLNDGTVATSGTSVPIAAAASGALRMVVSTTGGSSIDVTLDEIALAIGPQSAADVTAIYNGGAGKTWPL